MKRIRIPLCKTIAKRKLLDNKMQNICIMIAVMLTSILFIIAFSTIFYFNKSVQKAELRSAGWSAHGAIAGATEEEYERIAINKKLNFPTSIAGEKASFSSILSISIWLLTQK